MREPRLMHTVTRVTLFVVALWAIQGMAALLGMSLGPLGVQPREVAALHGVVTAPLVHGSYSHLMANTPALLVLGVAMLYGYPRASRIALPIIWLGSGLGVWLFAREAVHLGASGLMYGMMLFVFVMGILRRDRPSMALAMLVFFLYGGMIWGVLPLKPGISFESHLFGALAGVAAAFLLRHRDPLAERRVRKRPVDPRREEEDPVIGELWRDAEAPEVPRRRRDE
ncbi:rhomboid family intramembrane serine protease [Arhodomonas sp. AD133]|uniref:rhomboid family intramembrane serine protease n=1 Tax=Arhodomonas sp. AD133 TaxID=3415009 RepID=UPI003EBDE9C4